MTRTGNMKTETIQKRIDYHLDQARLAGNVDEDALAEWHEQQAGIFKAKLRERLLAKAYDKVVSISNLIFRKEMSDNFFYTSGRKDRLEADLRQAKKELAELEAQ